MENYGEYIVIKIVVEVQLLVVEELVWSSSLFLTQMSSSESHHLFWGDSESECGQSSRSLMQVHRWESQRSQNSFTVVQSILCCKSSVSLGRALPHTHMCQVSLCFKK